MSLARSHPPFTIGARIACLSSFYRFLQRMDIVTSNPCDKLERPRTSTPPARGLSADEVRRLLAAIPTNPQGLRDHTIILTLVLTGRRRAEVFRMTAGDLSFDNGVCFYAYRGKGGKTGRRELPRPVADALRAALTAFGKDLGTMTPTESLRPSPVAVDGRGLTSGTFYGRHSSLAVTTTYLRRLEGQEDRGWGKVAEALGLSDAFA